MKIALSIDRTEKLPKEAVPALEIELLKRLQSQFDDCSLVVRRAGSDSLSVYCGEKDVNKKIEVILLQIWESADDWFYRYSI